MTKAQGRIQGQTPPLRNFFQFARVFQEKKSKTPPKFSRSYKKILKPLPQKISVYVLAKASIPITLPMLYQLF